MPLFKKKKDLPKVQTFKERVALFWKWWSDNSERILQSVEDDGGATIQPEISKQVNLLGTPSAWVFGPHSEGKDHGHSFTLSPEGNRNYLFLTSYWLSQAPSLQGWEFYSSRQPSNELDGAAIHIGDFKLKTTELWLTSTVDPEAEELDIVAWSPIFSEVEESTANQVIFLLLDEALGENGVSQWLGRIEIKDGQTDHSFPLPELPEQLALAKKEYGWEDIPYEDSHQSYSFKEPSDHFPRADLITLTTQNPNIVLDHFDAEGKLEDPIADTGASYQFIKIPISQFPEGKEVELRGQWEDLHDDKLKPEISGRVLGGGLGLHFAYIDVLVFDGERSLQIIRDALDQNEVRKFEILPFAK